MDEARTTTARDGDTDEGTVDRAKEKAERMAAKARDRGGDLVDEGKEKARELGQRASGVARDQVDEQKDRVTDGMRSVATALRRGGEELSEDRRQYGRFMETIADQVEGASRYLEEHDVDELTRDVRRFARDHAPVFLSGAFTVGMLGARFLKSSSGGTARSDAESRRYAGRQPDQSFGRYEADERLDRPQTGGTTAPRVENTMGDPTESSIGDGGHA